MPPLPLSNVTAQESRSGVKRSYGLAGTELVSFDDLRTLAAAEHPCITAVVPIPNPTQIRTRMNHTVHEIEKRVGSFDHTVSVAGNVSLLFEAAAGWGVGDDRRPLSNPAVTFHPQQRATV